MQKNFLDTPEAIERTGERVWGEGGCDILNHTQTLIFRLQKRKIRTDICDNISGLSCKHSIKKRKNQSKNCFITKNKYISAARHGLKCKTHIFFRTIILI